MKVNNENGSDVSSDKTAENAVIVGRIRKMKKVPTENAVIVGRIRKMKKVPTYLNFGLICSSRTLVFKMD